MIRKEDTEMDFTDKAVFGQQMGGNCSVGCGAQTERDDESGRRGEGWGEYGGRGSEGMVFPELGK